MRRDVVDGHRDAVDADRVVPAELAGEERLGADPVGGRHEQRVLVPEPPEVEEAAEAADVAEHAGPERRADMVLDALDGLLAGGDVHARLGVRQARRLAAASAHAGDASPTGSDGVGVGDPAGSSSTCFESSVTGTGTG